MSERPLYVQVQENLAKLITSGEWQPEIKIPSERDLCQQIGVSRVTIRQAIQVLEEDGLLCRIQGKGTFVTKPKIEIDSRELVSFTASMSKRGIRPIGRVLDFGRIPANRHVARALGIELATRVYRVRRLRFANNLPLTIELAFFPCDRCSGLEGVDLATTSIHRLLEDMGIQIKTAYQTLEAVAATPEEAEILNVEPGFPLMLIQRRGFDVEGQAVEFSKDLFRGDCSRFVSNLQL